MRYLLLSLFLVFANIVYAANGPLDGQVFVGATGEQGKEQDDQDELRFSDGELYSEGCARWGFKGGTYSTEMVGDAIHFKATTYSPGNGTIVWEGHVKGDVIEATYTWTKERWWWMDARQAYWYKGERKGQ